MSISISCPIAEQYAKDSSRVALRSLDMGTLNGDSGDQQCTYDQLEQSVRVLAQKFQAMGISRGERVGIVSENHPLVVSVLFALQRIESTSLFLSLQLTPEDWAEQLRMGRVRFVIGQDAYLSLLRDRPGNTISFPQLEEVISSASRIETFDVPVLDPDNESSIIFTSSVTGHKKGVILTVGNFISSASASNTLTGLSPGDFWAVSLPLYHVGGLGIVFRTLLAGAGSTFARSFTSSVILSELARGTLTHISVVPTVLTALIEEAESSSHYSLEILRGLKAAILAGAPSSEKLLDKIIKYDLPVLGAWGMTETTAHCTCLSLSDPREKVVTVGKPFYHTEIRLVDESGKDVSGEGDIEGEIIVRGPTVCKGYLDPETPAPRIFDGWLHTGDLGSIDQDGFLTIKGRKDDMFISGGENIHAGEIESVVKKFWKIKDAAIIPVSHPKWGHRPVLIAETNEGSSVTLDEIKVFLSDKIAKIKIPDHVYQVDALPRTAIGKVDYKELKRRYC
jgi:O-succinylbenzoic acid--CoA ligase